MKIQKIAFIFTLAVMALVLSCIVFGADSGDAAVYFPLKPGNYWIYKLSVPGSSQVFEQKVKVDDPEDGKSKVIIYDPKGNPEVFDYYEQNAQGLFKSAEMASWGLTQYHPLWPVFRNKMTVGTSWNWESDDHKMKENVKITGIEKVTVPAGTYETLLVECSGTGFDGATYVDKAWYAKNLGCVRDEMTINGKTIISELKEYQVAK